jgi:CRP/FNR family transcriptional regulator, cyclic AMP receptor protein
VLLADEWPLRFGWLDRQPAALRQAILDHTHCRRLPGGATLHLAGDPPGGIYGVIEGALSLSFPDPRSEMHLADILLPGDWAGCCSLLDQKPQRFSVEALADTTLRVLCPTAMSRIAGRLPDSTRLFLDLAADALRVAEQALVDFFIPCPRRRIAAALVRCACGRAVTLPLSQAQLAALTNVSRKLVNSTLQSFRRAGWIEPGYASVTVLDIVGLAAFVDLGDAR